MFTDLVPFLIGLRSRTMGKQRQIFCPVRYQARIFERHRAVGEYAGLLVPYLIAMTIRTMDHRYTPAFGKAFDIRHYIFNTRGQDQFLCLKDIIPGIDNKPLIRLHNTTYRSINDTHRIIPKHLLTRSIGYFTRRLSIMGNEIV